MALYPTPPNHRMAYDRDGSQAFDFQTGTGGQALHNYSTAQMQQLNQEAVAQISGSDTAGGTFHNYGTTCVGVVFPELRDVYAYFYSETTTNAIAGNFQYSTNTTNGQDGTWTNAQALTAIQSPAGDSWRTGIQTLTTSISGAKGVRVAYTNANDVLQYQFHLYGMPSSGQNPDSLRIWQPVTNAEVTTVFDFGDIARGAAATQQFRVHNQSATKTASTITVSMEALTDASPSLIGQYQLSTDNVTFANSISIPNLGPGATSAVLYAKDTVAAGAQTGPWAARIVAAAGTFA